MTYQLQEHNPFEMMGKIRYEMKWAGLTHELVFEGFPKEN
jgi:hypothetical protein